MGASRVTHRTDALSVQAQIVLCCLGYGLLSGTRNTVLFVDTLFPSHVDRGADLFNYVLQATVVATSLLICLLLWKYHGNSRRFHALVRRAFGAQGALLAAGAGAVCLTAFFQPFKPLSVIAALLMGAGFALGSLSWVFTIARQERAQAIRSLIASWACSVVTLATLALLPTGARLVGIVATGAISCGAGLLLARSIAPATSSSSVGQPSIARTETSRPVYICLAMLTLGFVFGVGGPVLLHGAGASSGDPQTLAGHIAAIALAATLASLAIIAFPRQAGSPLAFQVALALDATATVALPFAGTWYTGAYNVIVEIIYRTSCFLLIYACVLVNQRERFCRTVPVLLSSGSVGLTLGVAFGSLLFSAAPNGSSAIMVITLVVLYLLFAAISTPAITAALKGTRASQTNDQPPKANVSDANPLAIIAKQYGLSEREASVMNYLSKGRNTTFIANQLGLSENTVKGYTKTLYKKLDVHARQDLINLVDSFADVSAEKRSV